MEQTKVVVSHAKNGIDFNVTVIRPNKAPQRINNLPISICLEICGCSEDEIKNHIRITN